MEPPRTPSSLNILVVDDYREITLLVRTALNSAGFHNVHAVSNPVKALEMADHQDYDLVIADLRMQPMDGVELFTRIRDLPGMGAVPFVIISAYADLDVIERMKALGVSGFVAKPFRTADLLRHVSNALGAGASEWAA